MSTDKSFWRWVAICVGIVVPFAVAVALWLGDLFTQTDSSHYLQLARGEPAMLPFASRQLGPLLVRGLSHLGLTVEQGFFALGVASLLMFVGTVAWLMLRAGTSRWLLVAVMGLSFWAQQFNGLVLPDLFYAALLCGFLLLLRRGWVLAACAMLLPLAVARETTVLVLVCLLAAGWRGLRWAERGLAMGSTLTGLLVVGWLTRGALSNQEHISPVLYLVAKMPWNFLKNFLGVRPWANVYPGCAVPEWQAGVHLGPLRAVGVCEWDWRLPVRLLGAGLASFGLLPLWLWRVWRDGVPQRLKPLAFGGRYGTAEAVPLSPMGIDGLVRFRGEAWMLRFCLVYGLASFLLAGVLGDRVLRLFEYGWPVFFVFLPTWTLSNLRRFRTPLFAGSFVGVHLLLGWAAVWLGGVPLLVAGLGAYGAGWLLLRRGSGAAGLRVEH